MLADVRRALVTGGAGFIGSHLCHLLREKGVEVTVVDDLSMGRAENLPDGVELHPADVRDPNRLTPLVAEVDVVFHLAARVSIRSSVDRFWDDAQCNVLGTLALLEACRRAPRRPRRVVLASSMAVYGDAASLPVSETSPLTPGSPYGVAKLASEQYLRVIADELGIEWVVLRYFNTYGERQTETPYVGVITIFTRALLRGETPTIFGDGSQIRDFVYAGDVARATWLAGHLSAARGGTYNVGTGRGTSVAQLYTLIADILGWDRDACRAPLPPGEPRDSVADPARAATELGFSAQARLEDRLPQVVSHLSARGIS